MPFADYGDVVAGLQDASVATWINTAGVTSYGALTDVMSVQVASTNLRVVTAELTGDDRITATMSRMIGGSINMRFAGKLLEVLAVVLGYAPTVTGITPSRVQQMMLFGGKRSPYFGMIGQGLAEEGLGDMLVFIPKAKVTSDITLTSMGYGEFQVAEFTASAVDDQDYGIINLIRRETTGAYTMPPAGIAAL